MAAIQKGFTLLEMIMTVFLIALASSFLVINYDFGLDDIAKHEASRFSALIQYCQDESILTGYPLAIIVDELDNTYKFSRFESKWIDIKNDSVLRIRHVPEKLSLSLALANTTSRNEQNSEGGNEDQNNLASQVNETQILIEPTGLVSHFRVEFQGQNSTYVVTLDTDQNIITGLKDEN